MFTRSTLSTRSSSARAFSALGLPVLALVALGLVSCGEDAKPKLDGNGADGGGTCPLNEDTQIEFTKLERNTTLSNMLCPDIDPDTLNGFADAGTEICQISVQDCVVTADCTYLTINVHGTLVQKDDELVGRFDVSAPIMCVYQVTAVVKE